MKKEEITILFETFEKSVSEYEAVECWSVRELHQLLGYSQWRNFENSINKAKESCQNAGQDAAYRFAVVSKTIDIPKVRKNKLTIFFLQDMRAIL